jgi:hypothetical protein
VVGNSNENSSLEMSRCRLKNNTVTCMLYAIWHVLTTVAMATDKHATMDNHATVEVFSLWSVLVMSYNNRGIGGGVFFVVCSRII